ncbi:hypothetical protein D3C80_1572650 [compost metagenome]
MKHLVHGGQADVLVHPPVTGDVVGVEQFVVIGASSQWACVYYIVAIGCQACCGRSIMGNIIEEGMAGMHGVG